MPGFQPFRFGKYIFLEKLAMGGMAQIYKAKITGKDGFEKLIAIKMLLPHLAKEKELIVSFIDEAKLAALLNHQNIVQIYDFGSMEESFFISMEYLFGNDLRAIWMSAREKNLSINLEYALYIMSRVCSGLAYAHELKDFQGNSLNIIHRDISPQNIFVTYQGEVKILDFGIAKAASQSTVTQCGMIKGKVAYMSPEQSAGKAINQQSDIYSAGIVLYELIAHKRMFDGDSTIQIMTKVRNAEYQPLQSVIPGLHSKVYGIVSCALSKDPEQRYQSCSEMAADLEECIIELGLRPNANGLARYMKALFDSNMDAGDLDRKEKRGSLSSGYQKAINIHVSLYGDGEKSGKDVEDIIKQLGYTVSWSKGDAISTILAKSPDILFSGLNIIHKIELLKSNVSNRAIRIILLVNNLEDEERAIQEKNKGIVDDYILDPYTTRDIREKIEIIAGKIMRGRDSKRPKKAFISYKWEHDAHNKWVEQLAADLKCRGVDAILDRWEVRFGDSFTDYMTTNVQAADVVLFVMTSASVKAVESKNEGGVKFEVRMATARKIAGKSRLIPILREGERAVKYLRDSRYIDFRKDEDYQNALCALVDDICGIKKAPPVNKNK